MQSMECEVMDDRDDFDLLREHWKQTPLKQEPFDSMLWFKSIFYWWLFILAGAALTWFIS